MRKLAAVLYGLVFLCSLSAWAQESREFPKAEVFGGFSVLRYWESDNPTIKGFQASATGNLHKNIGVVADFGGQFISGNSLWEYMFGPQFSVRRSRATFFTHALAGGHNADGGSNQFTLGFGGGLDVNINDRAALRVVQFDWMPVRLVGRNGTEWYKMLFRFGFGIVIK